MFIINFTKMNENINIALRVNTQDQSVIALRNISQGLSDVASAAARATSALNSGTNINQVFRSAPTSILQSSKAVTAYDEVIQGLFETIKETKDKGIMPLFSALPGGFGKSKKAASGFAGEIALIAASMANGFTGAAGTIGLFDRSISKAGTSLTANVSTSFFKSINKEVDKAVSGTAKLSSIIKAVGSVSEPFIEGFLGVGDRQPVLDSLAQKMQRVSQKTSQILAKKIPIVDINDIVSTYLQKAIPAGVDASRMSQERINRRLNPLQRVGNSLKENSAQLIQGSSFAQLSARDQTASLKNIVRRENEVLTTGLQFAFTQGVKSLDQVSGQMMRMVGRVAASPLTEELRIGAQEFDRLFNGRVQKFRENSLPKIATAARNKASLEGVAPMIAKGLGDVIPGSLLAGSLGDILQSITRISGTKELFQASGDDFAGRLLTGPTSPIVKALTKQIGYGNDAEGVEGGAGGLISSLFTTQIRNIPLLNQTAAGKTSNFTLGKGIAASIDMLTPFKPVVENLVLGLTDEVTTGITGALYNTVKTQISGITPSFVKAGYSGVKKLFPDLDKIIFDKFGDTIKTVFKPFARSDFEKEYGKLNKDIDGLTRKLIQTEPAGLDDRADQLFKQARRLEAQRRLKRVNQIKKGRADAERNAQLNSVVVGLLDPSGDLGLSGKTPAGAEKYKQTVTGAEASADYANAIIAGVMGTSGQAPRDRNALLQYLGERNNRRIVQEQLKNLPDNIRDVTTRIAGNVYKDPTKSIGNELMKEITSEVLNNVTSKLPSETMGGLSNAMLRGIVENVANVVAAAPEYGQRQAYKKEQELKTQAQDLRSQADLTRRGQRVSGVVPSSNNEIRFAIAQLRLSRQDDEQRQSNLQGFGESDQTKALTLELQRMLEARSVQRKLQNQENQRIADRTKLVELRSRRRELDAQKEGAYKQAGYLTEYRATVEANPIFAGNQEKTNAVYAKQQEIKRINDSIPSGQDIAPQVKVKRNRLQQELDLLMVPDSRRETRLYQVDQEIEKILAPYETVPQRVARKLQNFWPAVREVLKDPRGIEQLRKVDDFLEGALSEAATQVVRTSSREAVKGVGQQLISNMLPAIDAVDSAILGTVETVKNIPQRFISSSAATSNFFLGLADATEPLSALNTIISKVGQVGSSFFVATQQLAMFTSGFQGIAQIIQSSPLGLIIRQSDELEKQTISIQASLVATNKVAKGGLSTNKNESSYTDSSLEGINLSRGQVESGIDRIRKGSLEIANVTSSQLIDPFLNVASLSGVTRMNLDQSAELTLKFAAAMSTLNIPAGQNRQEIQSILRGTIDQNSVLAKTLSISNKQVLKWREQGSLYQNLSDRLKPLQEGQKIASGTVGGNISNIQELYETTLLNAGKPFMGFLKKEVSGLYEALTAATPQIQQTVRQILEQIIRIASATTKTFKELFGATSSIISPALIVIFKSFANIVDAVANAVQNAIKIMAPAITVFAALAQSALAVGGPFLQLGIQFKVLSMATGMLGGSFGLLARLLPGVGGLLGAVSVRSLPMINTFANLTGKVGAGSAAFLVLGQNMKHIPGLAGLATQSLSRFGPLAPIITSLIGPLSAVGIKASGVAQVFGSLGAPMFFTNLAKSAPAAITAFAAVAKNASFLSGNTAVKANIDTVASSLKEYIGQLTNSSQANNLLANSARAVGVEFRNWALSTTLLAGGLYLAFQAVDKFILKNKEGMVIISGITSGLQDFAKLTMQIATINIPVTVAVLTALITKGQIVTTVISGLLAMASPLLAKLGFLGVLNNLAINPTLANLRGLAAVNLIGAANQTEKLSMALAHIPIIGGLASTRMMGLSSALTGLGNVFEVAALKAKAAQAQILAVDAASKLSAASARVLRAEQIGASSGAIAQALAAEASARQAAQSTAANASAMGVSLVNAANGAKTMRQSVIGFEAAAAGTFALKGSITGMVGAIAGIISPLVIIGGLLATIGLAFSEFKLGGTVFGVQIGKGAIQAADEMALATAEIQGSLQITTGSIKKARKEQQERTSAGIALTDAEYAANEKLKKQAEAGIASAEQDIESNKKALGKEENEDLKGVYERNIANAEGRIKDLKAAMEGVDFVPKDIERMGGVLEQLGFKAEQAMRALATPSGDSELLKKQATALIDTTKQQLELGAIAPEIAKERLKLVTENTGLELEIRRQGAQAITDTITIEADRRVEKETETRSATQQMVSEELMGEEKAQRMTTESTLREIDIRMEAERKAYEERSVARIKETQETINELDKQIKAIEDKLNLSGPNAAKALESKIARLQSQLSGIAAKQNELFASKSGIEASGVDTGPEQNAVAKIDAKLTELAKTRSQVLNELNSATASVGKPAPVMSATEKQNLEKELLSLNSQKTIAETETKGSLEDIERRHNSKMQELDAQKAKTQKEQLDKNRQEQLKDFDERQKINDSERDRGLKDNQQAANDSLVIAEDRAKTELSQIKDKTAKLDAEAQKQGKTVKEYDKEAWEALQVQQAEALQKLAVTRKDAIEKKLSDLKQDVQEATAIVDASEAKGDITGDTAAVKTTEITTASINERIKLLDEEISKTKGNKERIEELNAQKANSEKELTEVTKQELQKRFGYIQKKTDEKLAGVNAKEATGSISADQATQESLAIQQEGEDKKLKIVRDKIEKMRQEENRGVKINKEQLAELEKQEAESQSKISQIRAQAYDKRHSLLKSALQKELAEIETGQAKGQLDNQQAAKATAKAAKDGIKDQIRLIEEEVFGEVVQMGNGQTFRKSPNISKEREKELYANRAELEKQLTQVSKTELDKRLADLREDAEKQTAVITAANATGSIDNQQAATDVAETQKKSLNSQLNLIRQNMGGTNKERLEELKKQEAEVQIKITEIQKQEFNKRVKDLEEDINERTALIESANAKGLLDNQQAAIVTEAVQIDGTNKQIDLIKKRINEVRAEGAKIKNLNTELLEELQTQEANAQKKLIEIRKQAFQKQLSDLQQDSEEQLAVINSLNAQGIIDNQKAATQSTEIQKQSLLLQLRLVQERVAVVGGTNKELSEELLKQEADIQVKITETQKQELQKRLSDLQQDSQERVLVIETAAATGVKDNQQAATEIENIQRQSVNDQLNLVRERIAATSPLNEELNEELKAQKAKLQKELTEIQEQGFQKRLSDLQQDGEERLAIITTNGVKGLTDNQETASKSAAIQEESAQKQLNLIRDRLAETSTTSRELRENLLKQEADTEAKIIEIRKQAFDKRLADIDQDAQEQQTILEGQLAQGLTTEAGYAESRYNQSLQSLDAQLALIRERRSQISATDIEGQEALAAQEATLQKRRQDALSQFLEAQLSLLDRENKKATDLLEQSELDRKLITKQAAMSGSADKDAAATAEIQATQRRIQQEIALEEQKNATLRSLPAFSDPAKEAERQSRIRASVKKTTELRLQLLDEEKKAFDLLVERQIKGIQNQAREQELASDVQVRAIEQQGKQYDLLSRSLENQNKLLQSRASLANALNGYIQGEYKILQDAAGSEGERKRLIKEAADAQLVAMQQQQVVAQKNLDIEIKQAEIAQKRAEFEAEIAEIRARAGSAKADAEVLKAEATLQKVQRDPNASSADVKAAELDVVAARAAAEAAVADIAFAIANKEIVGQNGEVLKEQNNLKRETQSIEQVTQGRAAQAQAIEAIVDENEKKLRQRQLAGRLTPEESERLARIQRENQQREATRRRDEIERDTLRGIVTPNGVRQGIQNAGVRSGSLLQAIEQTAATAPKVPELKNLIAQMNVQRQQISVKPEVNPLIRLQEESTGYQKEMLGVLKQLNEKPTPAPVTPVANNFNIKAEAGISEAQVLGVFGQVSQQVTQMLKR